MVLLVLDALGRREGVLLGEVGVDRDGQPDLTAELVGQSLGDVHPKALLHEVLGEVVRDGDECGVVEESDEPGHAQEGPSSDRDAVGIEGVEGGPPHLTEVDLGFGHGRTPLSLRLLAGRVLVTAIEPHQGSPSTALSTTVGTPLVTR